MTLKSNPQFKLTPSQTQELKDCWNTIRRLAEPSKNTLVTLKLSRNCAVLSRKQLYMIAATMVNLGVHQIPEWVHELLDKPQVV
jgi:hypothetical protein